MHPYERFTLKFFRTRSISYVLSWLLLLSDQNDPIFPIRIYWENRVYFFSNRVEWVLHSYSSEGFARSWSFYTTVPIIPHMVQTLLYLIFQLRTDPPVILMFRFNSIVYLGHYVCIFECILLSILLIMILFLYCLNIYL